MSRMAEGAREASSLAVAGPRVPAEEAMVMPASVGRLQPTEASQAGWLMSRSPGRRMQATAPGVAAESSMRGMERCSGSSTDQMKP